MSPMPNFQPNQNPSHDKTTSAEPHTNNDIDNNILPIRDHQSSHVLLTTISVEQPDDESNASTVTDDNVSVRSDALSDDINRNPDDILDGDKPPKAIRQRSSLPKDASIDVLASKTYNYIMFLFTYFNLNLIRSTASPVRHRFGHLGCPNSTLHTRPPLPAISLTALHGSSIRSRRA